MLQVTLPVQGLVKVSEDSKEPGHYWWQSSFGWHDCTRTEDQAIGTMTMEFGEESLPHHPIA
jgi:hypothetical protein